jgi:23S rRNA pseudouridine1911/1915/1917 synthase
MSDEAAYLEVSDAAAGTRLDAYTANRLGNLSRARVQRAIEDGEILVNERTVKASYRLRAGDRIDLDLTEPPPSELLPEALPISIVFEDEDLVVVDKAAGMVVHPGAGVSSGTLANALAYHFQELSREAGPMRPGIVHRLDRDTSGLIVVAKNDQAHEALSEQFRSRQVVKVYIALVHGGVRSSSGEITARIGRSRHNRTRMAVLRSGGREAITLFEVAVRYQEFSLLRVRIKTGRTHQIRVHLSHIGHPVAGDSVYGKGRAETIRDRAARSSVLSLGRHFLHSATLQFKHPRTGEQLDFVSPLPDTLVNCLSTLGQPLMRPGPENAASS